MAGLFADYAITFNRRLADIENRVKMPLPPGYRAMNPFARGEALAISNDFYRRFYADSERRRILLGINPGRHGAGLTGVPFTDSKQLDALQIDARDVRCFEPSAVFIYRMIGAFGGPQAFYRRFYINSPLPLGLVRRNERGAEVNANYYDKKELEIATGPMIDYAMDAYALMPIDTQVAYCLGQGKNYQFLKRWNDKRRMFDKLVPLAHPRYVMQYKFKQIDQYVEEYLSALRS